MKKKLGIIYFGFICILLSGCSHAAIEKYEISDLKISLDTEKCSLKVDGRALNIEMQSKCYFVKDSGTGIVGVKYYSDIESHVLLIVGNSVSKDPDYPLTLTRNDCGSKLRALVIKNKTAMLSVKIFSNTLTCAGIGVDEKEYYILSHP
ncbi:MAG TPA: hypothetical protein ENI94_12030 [Gammaproteobacteria bacterium]|nr:hypothetical protein [Gammaproteobacteria bacterium]